MTMEASDPAVVNEGAVAASPSPPQEEPVDLSARFAALARREKRAREVEARLKAQQEQYQQWEHARKAAKTNPIAFMEQNGLSYKEITDYLLNDNAPTPEQRVKALEEKLEQDRADREAAEQGRREAEINRTIETAKANIEEYVLSQGEAYELIQANGAYDTVFEVIQAYWNRTGEMLPVDTAAKYVEEHLEEQARKLLSLKKLAPKAAEAAVPELQPGLPSGRVNVASPGPTTLTNSLVAGASPPPAAGEYLSDEESKRRAAALLRWT